jgi:hypothetical protein
LALNHPLWPLSTLCQPLDPFSLLSPLSLSSLSLLSLLLFPCLFPVLVGLVLSPDSLLFLFVCLSFLFPLLAHFHTNRLRSAGLTQDLPFSSTEYYHHHRCPPVPLLHTLSLLILSFIYPSYLKILHFLFILNLSFFNLCELARLHRRLPTRTPDRGAPEVRLVASLSAEFE